jgi:dihydrofolate reductase
MIAAVDRHGAIGRANQLPWRLPDDLQRFKALTLRHYVIMGRKTFESIGRPLPGRTNVIITRKPDFAIPGAQVVHSLEDALALCAADDQPFIIGGGEIYRQALPLTQTLYLTEVDTVVPDADATFPHVDLGDWHVATSEPHPADARHAYGFRWVRYQRIAR